MTPPTIVFLGSFLHYSAYVLGGLLDDSHLKVGAVITTPPHPQGRQKILTTNPVHQLALDHEVPVFTPDKLTSDVLAELTTTLGAIPDLLVTAGYGKLLPVEWLTWPRFAALNLHLSLLPSYRGANPAEWALLLGERQTGVTVIEMSPEFDTGQMVAQASLTLSPTETRESAYEKVYQLGARILPSVLERYVALLKAETQIPSVEKTTTFFSPAQPQPPSPTPYARRLGREDGFVRWTAIQAAMAGHSFASEELGLGLQEAAQWQWPQQPVPPRYLQRAARALAGYPGLWTTVPTAKGDKRLKLLEIGITKKAGVETITLERVQLEGQAATTWVQLKSVVI